MWLKQITLKHYRNYEHLQAQFSPCLNIFIGQNAQGKTNFLEAIYFLALTRSHRTRRDRDLIQFGQDTTYLSGLLEKQQGRLTLELGLSNKGRVSKVNHLKQNRLSDYIGQLTVVLFAPEDLQLIKGSPKLRRKFMDIDLGQIKPLYLADLALYNHTLKQRNHYLKTTQTVDVTFLEVLDEQLVDYGCRIMQQRYAFINQLNQLAKQQHQAIAGGLEELQITYQSSINFTGSSITHDNYLTQLQERRSLDLKTRTTTLGPHRDDILFIINSVSASFASQGQHRSLVLALKLAEIELIKDTTGESPLLLLDDVMSELDTNRQERLLNAVLKEKVQTFITTTSLEHLKNLPKNLTLFHIKKGYLLNQDTSD